MIKKVINIILTTFIVLSFFCKTDASEIKVTSLSINNGKTLYLAVDDFVSLDVKVNPISINKDDIKFSSSSTNIADVDYNGNVTAKRVGRTTITAEINGRKASITVSVSEINKSLGVDFSFKNVSGTNFKEITVTPHRYDDGEIIVDDADNEYYIYLPSGYLVQGKTASYVADRNGVYPFTVYYRNDRKTFYYTVKDIDNTSLKDKPYNSSEDSKDNIEDIHFDYKLMYDYEKKQLLFNTVLDKVRTVITPDKKTTVSNEINYYINTLNNNTPLDFTITVDDIKYDYKVIKQGEFYLLISLLPVDYDNYSTIVNYFGYNFISNETFSAIPNKDIFYDNGNYEVLIKSNTNTKEIFNFNISGIDFRRPSVDISILGDYTFNLNIVDDFDVDYIITFDGKYVPIGNKSNNSDYTYNHKTKILDNGDYVFTVVDKAGNRTVTSTNIKTLRDPRKHSINFDVHNYKYTKDIFENIGLEYYNDNDNDDDLSLYDITLPAYMNGSNSNSFKPDLPITRAEIVTLFCRITDLPFDTGAFFKSKFTDIENHWAKDYIAMGSSKRYVAGYKDKTFRPNENVTKAEFCKMLTNIKPFKSKLSSLPATNNFDFADINNHWAKKEIATIARRDIVLGSNNYFYPDKQITRGEVIHAINTLYALNPSANELKYIDSLYKKYYNFNDITNHKYYNDIIISLVGMYREKIK